jgi:outer membrane receptor protein involved in Fe transport
VKASGRSRIGVEPQSSNIDRAVDGGRPLDMRTILSSLAAIILLAIVAARAGGQSSASDPVEPLPGETPEPAAPDPRRWPERKPVPPVRPKAPSAEKVADGGVVQTPSAPGDGGALDADGGPTTADAGVPASDGGAADAEGGVPAPPPPDPFAAKPLEEGADRQTGIRGRIVDQKTGLPLAKAPVLAKGSDGKTRPTLTDAEGNFQLFVPPGSYTLRSYFSLYHGVRMERVPVKRGSFASVRLVLQPIDIAQDIAVIEIEIPYRADTTTIAAQDQLRKEARGIGEGMGAQQMSQQGAGDAAAAARRVVGVTIESNQLIIRGLGGRYVRVFLNGLPIPNTDPDFPSVDLDLFPTSIIDNLNVQKVFLPEIPADFAGGILDINTVSFPRKRVIAGGVGSAYNSQTTFKNNLSYRGGGTDWLGFDDGTRALPAAVKGVKLAPQNIFTPGGLPPDELERLGESFQNRWNTRTTAGLPQIGFNLTVGNSFNFAKKRRFGFLTSLVYDYALERLVGVTRPKPGIAPDGQVSATNIYNTETGNESVQLSAIGTASLDLGLDHSLTVLTLFNRSMDDQTRYRIGTNADLSMGPYDAWQLRFLARTLSVNQILGDHRNLGGTRLRLRWSAFYAIGQRDEPDQRVVKYGYLGSDQRRWVPTADRLWSALSQKDIGATAQLRFPLWAEAWGTIGARIAESNRDFSNRRFVYQMGTPDPYTADPETLFSNQGIGTIVRVLDFTNTRDSYLSSQRGYAAFLMLETPVVGPLSASGGARLEVFSQRVQSQSPFAEDNTPENLAMNRTDRKDMNLLPGAALKYAVSNTMLLRAAYGTTVSRPQVRELAPYDYYDFLRDRKISGNPNLKTATIHNLDARWEWFFGEGQVAAVSGFYKRFIDPIELQIIDTTTQDSTYQNARGATSLGAEFELRSDLARLSRMLRRFTVGGNLSLIRSRIELVDTGATRATRPLAGQAPYVINLSLRYAVPEMKLSLGFVYNVVGPRITDVGVRSATQFFPDVEEQAFHSLDFVGSWALANNVSLKLRARNLLLQQRILKQGPVVSQELKPGITISMGLGFDY